MCGIAGQIHVDGTSLGPADERTLDRMLDRIVHRGPDDEGKLVDGPLAMGMRRLSIIDLQDGQQPIFDESGKIGIVFNGEIYNYRELRVDLMKRGHQFRTNSDTEVVVHLYEEMGADCVHALRGMFGFAIWDRRTQELFIARDRLGVKPLYFATRGKKLLFASEIKSILADPSVQPELDHRSLSEYLSLKYVPSPRTMFAGIESLPPGHSMRVSRDGYTVQRYWDIRFQEQASGKSDDEYVDELLHLLRESVRLRLRSDVPFGAFLSGGVDSSTIVALMSEAMSEPVKTFSVGFDGGDEPDELPFANEVATRFGCEHHTLTVNANDFLEHAENVLWHLDQPIADQATVATHMVAKLARQHVKMVLSGEGGDELFAGYARYGGEQYSPWSSMLPSFSGPIIRRAVSHMPGMRRAKIAINALTIKDEAQRFANWFPLLSDDSKAMLLDGPMLECSEGAASVFAKQLSATNAKLPLNRMLYVDSKLWLPDYLLLRGDKLTMANSLEARVPLLDHKLVEFAASLPTRMKLRGKTRKWLLKEAAGRLLPRSIIHRKKQGFPIPIEKWLRVEARPLMRDLLAQNTLQQRGLFDPSFVNQLMNQHESGYADHATELWGLMSIEMWMRRFIDGPDVPACTAQDNAGANATAY